jgi:hypothetical protein
MQVTPCALAFSPEQRELGQYSMEPQSGSRWFPENVTALLESFYRQGLTGWGKQHAAMFQNALTSTGLTDSQLMNWIRRRNTKRKAGQEEREVQHPMKKRKPILEAGSKALVENAGRFDQEAADASRKMSPEPSTNAIAERDGRAATIFQDIHKSFDALNELGYTGFAIAFRGEEMEITGTSSATSYFSPPVLDYLHALIQAATPPPLPTCCCSCGKPAPKENISETTAVESRQEKMDTSAEPEAEGGGRTDEPSQEEDPAQTTSE